MDAHINYPSLLTRANPIWVEAATIALTSCSPPKMTAGGAIPVNNIEADDEYAMMKELVRLRNASPMSDGSKRSACILMCARGLGDPTQAATLATTWYGTGSLTKMRSDSTFSQDEFDRLREHFGFLEHQRPP